MGEISDFNSNHGSELQLTFRKCFNLRKKNGGIPNAAVYVKYMIKDKKVKSSVTSFRKAHEPEWCENSNILSGLRPETEFTFVVIDSVAPLLKPTKIAESRPYTLKTLLELRHEADIATKDKMVPTDFSIPLVSVGEATAEAPSLLLRLREFLSREQMNHHVAQLGQEVKTKNRHGLENEKLVFVKELELLSGSIPNTAKAKTFIDVTSGLFASIVPLMDNDTIDDFHVLHLLRSYRTAVTHIRSATAGQSADLIIQLYGQVLLDIVHSLRFLERCLRNPLSFAKKEVVDEILSTTKDFDTFDKDLLNGSFKSLDTSILGQRAGLRKVFAASNSAIVSKLNPIFDIEPSRPCRISARHPPATIQTVSSWSLLSSYSDVKRLLWLHGPGSCGKTQLATTLMEVFGQIDVPSAYFSFDNHSAEDSINTEPPSLNAMTRTLAFQLASYVEGFGQGIANAVQSAGIDELDFAELFNRLIIVPLQVHSRGRGEAATQVGTLSKFDPIVIIIDDLDQCSESQLEELLSVLGDNLTRLPKEVRILVFGRTLESVRMTLEKNPMASIVEYSSSMTGLDGETLASMMPLSPSRASSIKWAATASPTTATFATAGNSASSNGAGGSSGAHSPPSSRRNSASGPKGKRTSGSLGSINEFEIMEVSR
ncbi:hypothetical protein EST38_g3480 [Candolleomyces aberdarensis]|uniref:Nephrocystin 3-like N-terminal domain-containing protein n=1 Tax=Candolleomyces aberdarensis TaxID=2316362 RepID=A0A4Q2DQP9_9AGAR|nr:hypothetical protein EST38_g3480 [Candolleomyces aberdarensis]